MALMLTKRIIPCLDVKDGRVVKGRKFVDFKDAGDPVELARMYNEQGADELSFLDITASFEKRKIVIDLVRKVAKEVFIPFSVGGGISSVEMVKELINAGAEKVSIGTAAVRTPSMVEQAARECGSQAVVVSIDAKRKGNGWTVWIEGGKKDTGKDALAFAQEMEQLGAGEILLNSIDKDGTKGGFDIELTRRCSEVLNIPVIASGGAGTLADFEEVLTSGKADAALAASLFHFSTFTIADVKKYLRENSVEVRL